MNSALAPNLPAWLPADPRARRSLALGLLILLLVILAAAIVVPAVLLHRHYDANLSRMTRQLDSQSAFNQSRPRVTKALEGLRGRDIKKLYLKGSTAALASAELQDQVKALIEANSGRVQSVQGIAYKDDPPYRTVAATYQLSINNMNLRRVLHALETQEPYVFIDNLTIRSHTPPGFRPPPGSPEPEMFVQFDASGIAHIAEAGAAAPASGGKAEGGKP